GLAWLKIRTRTGEEVAAWLYQTHGARGAYNVGGTYYRGGSDEAFIHTLLECHKHAQAKGRAEHTFHGLLVNRAHRESGRISSSSHVARALLLTSFARVAPAQFC